MNWTNEDNWSTAYNRSRERESEKDGIINRRFMMVSIIHVDGGCGACCLLSEISVERCAVEQLLLRLRGCRGFRRRTIGCYDNANNPLRRSATFLWSRDGDEPGFSRERSDDDDGGGGDWRARHGGRAAGVILLTVYGLCVHTLRNIYSPITR